MQNLKAEQLEAVRNKLEQAKADLYRQLEELKSQDPYSDPDRGIDNAASDREASEEADHDRVAAMMDQIKARIMDTDRALDAIGRGVYGKCLVCSGIIPEKRLEIMPATVYCVSCEPKKTVKFP